MKMPKPLGFIARQARVRPLACFSAAFLAGILLERRFAAPMEALLGGAVAALATGVAMRGRRGAIAAFLALGLCAGAARMQLARAALPAGETRYSVDMVGEVIAEPFTHPDTGRRISRFRVETVNGKPSGLLLRLYLRGDADALEAVDCGQRLSFRGHIWACDPVTNPHEFDFGDYLNRDGLAAYATAKIEDVTVLETRGGVRTAIIAARRALAARIDALLPDNAGLARALMLGDRSLLGEEMREALRRTGTAHLIAISGLHVSVLALAVSALLRRLTSRRFALAATLALLVVYGALIGFTAPFVRAAIMFAVAASAFVPGLPSDAATRLGAAMLALLLVRPMEALETGFALSFAASAGLILLSPPIAALLRLEGALEYRPGGGRLVRLGRAARRYFAGLVVGSLAAQLAILPAVIAGFGTQPLLSLPFNLVCVPLCMLGYLFAAAALPLSALWLPMGMGAGRIADVLFSGLTAVWRWGAALPLTDVHIGRYPGWLVAAHIAVVLAASGFSRAAMGKRRWLPLALVGIAALSSLNTWARALPFGVTFLDAGQADSAVVRTLGRTYLIDAGDTYTPAADYLSATCLHLDGVFLSHPHQDHAGGLTDVLNAFKPDIIYVPEGWYGVEEVSPAVTEGMALAARMGVPVVELSAGDVVALSRDATLTVYSPDGARPPQCVNDMSMLARVSGSGQDILFTGDLTVEGEPPDIPDADILKVAHHGSKDASSARFIEATSPELAVISVGENNFGHPADEVLERLAAAGARILLTRESGAIEMTWFGGRWRVHTFFGGWQ